MYHQEIEKYLEELNNTNALFDDRRHLRLNVYSTFFEKDLPEILKEASAALYIDEKYYSTLCSINEEDNVDKFLVLSLLSEGDKENMMTIKNEMGSPGRYSVASIKIPVDTGGEEYICKLAEIRIRMEYEEFFHHHGIYAYFFSSTGQLMISEVGEILFEKLVYLLNHRGDFFDSVEEYIIPSLSVTHQIRFGLENENSTIKDIMLNIVSIMLNVIEIGKKWPRAFLELASIE